MAHLPRRPNDDCQDVRKVWDADGVCAAEAAPYTTAADAAQAGD